jgi:hypothetical protein
MQPKARSNADGTAKYSAICADGRAAGGAIVRRGWGFFRPVRLHPKTNTQRPYWPRSSRLTAVPDDGDGSDLGHGLIGAAVAAWPAVALVGSYELLMMIIRGAQAQPDAMVMPRALGADPLRGQAAQAFADDLVANRVPSVRAIRARLHVGQPRAQQVRAYLAAIAARPEASAKATVLQTLHRDAATSEGALPDDILDGHSAYSA